MTNNQKYQFSGAFTCEILQEWIFLIRGVNNVQATLR